MMISWHCMQLLLVGIAWHCFFGHYIMVNAHTLYITMGLVELFGHCTASDGPVIWALYGGISEALHGSVAQHGIIFWVLYSSLIWGQYAVLGHIDRGCMGVWPFMLPVLYKGKVSLLPTLGIDKVYLMGAINITITLPQMHS